MLRDYDSKGIDMAFGIIPFEGLAEDFLSIVFDDDAYRLDIGSDGEQARSKTNNNSATIEVTLQQTSPTNLLLSAQHKLDKLNPGGPGVAPFIVRDANGTTLDIADAAWIQKEPDHTFGRDIGTRTWTFRTGNMNSITGGNNSIG